jgi:hypothetical protein
VLIDRKNTLVAGEGKGPSSVSIHEYKYTVNVGGQHIKITGNIPHRERENIETVYSLFQLHPHAMWAFGSSDFII